MTMTRSNEEESKESTGTAEGEGKRRSVRDGSYGRERSSPSDSINSTFEGAEILAWQAVDFPDFSRGCLTTVKGTGRGMSRVEESRGNWHEGQYSQ